MNKTIRLLQQRSSTRVFEDRQIEQKILDDIVSASQQAPTSINAQQTSLIITKDKNKIAQIANCCGNQKQVKNATVFITVIGDFFKTKTALELINKEQAIHMTLEGIFVVAVDGGIVAEAVCTAAESFGIGNVMIGAIRSNPEKIISLLKLPKYTFPIVGISLGYPNKKAKRDTPSFRLNKKSYYHKEEYDSSKLEPIIKDANKNWNQEDGGYSGRLASYYTKPYFKDIKRVLEKQGFGFD